MGKDKIEESFIFGVLKGFLGKLRWKTSFRELCITWKTLFLIGSLGRLCMTLKFERVLFDYNDQCHGG